MKGGDPFIGNEHKALCGEQRCCGGGKPPKPKNCFSLMPYGTKLLWLIFVQEILAFIALTLALYIHCMGLTIAEGLQY